MFYVYILKSSKDKGLYTGFTNNLKRRIKEHQQKQTFTTRKGSYDLVYYESYKSKNDAVRRERGIKDSGSVYMALKKRIKESLED